MFSLTKKNLYLLIVTVVASFSLCIAPVFAQSGTTEATDNTSEIGSNTKVEFDTVSNWVYSALVTIGAIALKIGGSILDAALSLFVFDMAGTVKALGIDSVITTIWALVRDLFNLLFIFGVIFIGFKIILGIEDSKSKRSLGFLIVAALFINFSLYATQVIVDFGNIAAAEIRSMFETNERSEYDLFGSLKVVSITSGFLETTNLNKLKDNTLLLSNELKNGEIEVPQKPLGIADALGMGLSIALMFILIGFVFAAGAVFVLARFFILVFLMMFSPVMFLGFVLPNFKKVSSDWWQRLFSQTLLGPAFLFMLYIALRAMQAISDNIINNQMSTMSFMISSVLITGFVWTALEASKKIGAVGASVFMKIGGDTARSVGIGIPIGLSASFMRGTVGRGSYNLSQNENLKNSSSQSGIRGWASRQMLNSSSKLADASFDARQTKLGSALKAGSGFKGGYQTRTEQIAKKEADYAKGLGEVGSDDPRMMQLQSEIDAVDLSIKNTKDQIQSKRKLLSSTKDEAARQTLNADIESARAKVEDLEEEKSKRTEALTAERYRRQTGSRFNISEATNSELKTQKDNLTAHISELADIQEQIRQKGKSMTPAELKALEDDKIKVQEYIAQTKKAIAEVEKKANKEAGGYNQVVESSGVIKNLLFGRDKSQNENAANEIRKTYSSRKKPKAE